MNPAEMRELRKAVKEATQDVWVAAVGEKVIYSGLHGREIIAEYTNGRDGRYIELVAPFKVQLLLDYIDFLEALIDMALPRVTDAAFYLAKARKE